MRSSRLSRWIRSALLATLAGCGSDTPDTPIAAAIKRISLIGPADSIPLGVTYQMSALNDAGRPIVSPSLVWNSSAPSVADVSVSGLVTPHAPGVTIVSAAVGSVAGRFEVRVGAYRIA